MPISRMPKPVTLEQIAHSCHGIILDIFGVLHDGVALFGPVHETLSRLRASGTRVCLLSNSPRRAATIAARLFDMGLGPDLYRDLISSGEMVRAALVGSLQLSMPSGRRYLHAGPEELAGLLDGLPYRRVASAAKAEFILATGNDEEFEIGDAVRRALPMICANPDFEVIIGGRRLICAGSLALRYEAAGGNVIRIGKPEPSAYIRALRVLDLPPAQVIAIGDSLATDVAGANRAGIASALVMSGIHRDQLYSDGTPDPDCLESLCRTHNAWPSLVLSAFAWR